VRQTWCRSLLPPENVGGEKTPRKGGLPTSLLELESKNLNADVDPRIDRDWMKIDAGSKKNRRVSRRSR